MEEARDPSFRSKFGGIGLELLVTHDWEDCNVSLFGSLGDRF